MITLKLDSVHLTPDQAEHHMGRLGQYIQNIHDRDQGWYEVIDDQAMINDVKAYAQSVQGKYDHIVLLGIGGSALGMQTVRDSLSHLYEKSKPELHILDNIDPMMIREIESVLDLKKTLFLVITKSGTTPEILSLYGHFRDLVEKNRLDPKDHFVAVTLQESGWLRDHAEEQGIPSFSLPENVGGRFSVLSAVGLLPTVLMGINIERLLQGARDMRDAFLSNKYEDNLCFQLALTQYIMGEHGHTNVVMMPYAQKLKTFASWYAQLLAESTGKINKYDNHTGLSPVAALGVTDQHSQLQLYTQGPNDKQIMILKVENMGPNVEIPDLGDKPKVAFLKGVDFKTLLHTEMEATADTLTEEGRPNYQIIIDQIDEYRLGELFMLFEGTTAFLGEMLQINAFDQPGVERSKILTREYLTK